MATAKLHLRYLMRYAVPWFVGTVRRRLTGTAPRFGSRASTWVDERAAS